MVKLFASWANVPANNLWIMCAVVFLGFHTLLFTNVSRRLDQALKRVDKLENILANIIANNDLNTREVSLAELSHIKTGVRSMLGQTLAVKKLTRTIRSTDTITDVERNVGNDKRIDRLEKKVKRCLNRLREVKHKLRNGGFSLTRPPRSISVNMGTSRSKRSFWMKKDKRTNAVFTVWGASKCIKRSRYRFSGQTVVVGSEFLCLSDNSPVVPFRINRTRNLFKGHVGMRGVKYGDIEDVMHLQWRPPEHGRNNKTMPCVVCSREGMTSSTMLLAKTSKFSNAFREYNGVLMSSKHTKQGICVSNDASNYTYTNKTNRVLTNAVQLHAAELDCNSVHCDVNKHYKSRYRVGCSVMTI